MKTKLIP